MGTVRLRAIRTQLHISPCISSLSLLPSSWPLVPKLPFLPAFPLPMPAFPLLMPVFLTLTPPAFTIPMLLPPLATPFRTRRRQLRSSSRKRGRRGPPRRPNCREGRATWILYPLLSKKGHKGHDVLIHGLFLKKKPHKKMMC